VSGQRRRPYAMPIHPRDDRQHGRKVPIASSVDNRLLIDGANGRRRGRQGDRGEATGRTLQLSLHFGGSHRGQGLESGHQSEGGMVKFLLNRAEGTTLKPTAVGGNR
jgi:hypothetical protein